MQQIHGLIHMKNWKFLKETCRYRNERDKNGVSICDGYPNQYGGPHNVLREFFLVFRVPNAWIYTYEKLRNLRYS